jgi:hypothetical protein
MPRQAPTNTFSPEKWHPADPPRSSARDGSEALHRVARRSREPPPLRWILGNHQCRSRAAGAAGLTPIPSVTATSRRWCVLVVRRILRRWHPGLLHAVQQRKCNGQHQRRTHPGVRSTDRELVLQPRRSSAVVWQAAPLTTAVMEYSAKRNMAVYGGGNAAPRKLWHLNGGRQFQPPDRPAARQGRRHAAGRAARDPAKGNFLLLSAGELWELALRVPAAGALSEARGCRRQG